MARKMTKEEILARLRALAAAADEAIMRTYSENEDFDFIDIAHLDSESSTLNSIADWLEEVL